jgi:hypothetical protein
MTITLTTEIEKGLLEQAQKMGTSPEALAIETLRRKFASASGEQSTAQGNLIDFLGDFVGCISSDEHVPHGARISKDAGRQFVEGLIEKRSRGHL